MPVLSRKSALLCSLALTGAGLLAGCGVFIDVPDTHWESSHTTVYTSRPAPYVRQETVIVHDEPVYVHDEPVYAPMEAPMEAPMPTAAGRDPLIQSFTANPTNLVPAGQDITFQVVAYDPGDRPMQFNWSATGGTLSTNAGRVVVWTPPEKAGTYTVSTIITNASGGAVTGAQNLIVKADGSVKCTAQ